MAKKAGLVSGNLVYEQIDFLFALRVVFEVVQITQTICHAHFLRPTAHARIEQVALAIRVVNTR